MAIKTLCLVRHGNARRDDPAARDIDRPLTERGREDALRTAARYLRKGYMPDLIITSPAVRARTTARLMARTLRYPARRIQEKNHLYNAEIAQICRILYTTNNRVNVLMIVGHNPGMKDVIEYLTGADLEHFPTAGICIIRFDVDEWRNISTRRGGIIWQYAPRASDFS